MSVFTIYCRGTGGHRDNPDDEIVAFMGRPAVLFETLCPTLYRWLFTMADATQGLAGRAVSSSHPAGREIGAAVGTRPKFMESLATLGVDIQGTVVKLPAPGSAFDARALHDLQARGDLTQMGVL